jgi:hypothetical protein
MRILGACLGVGLALLLVSCGGDPELGAQVDDSTTPTSDATQEPSSGAPQTTPETPTVVETPGAQPSVAPGPTTYVDPTYGYSYEVPAGWFVSGSGGGLSILTSWDPRTAPGHGFGCVEESGIVKADFYVEENPQGLTLDAWLAERGSEDVVVLDQSEFTVDGVVGIRRIVSANGEATADHDTYFFKVGNRIYSIVAACFDPDLGIVSTVLPTIRFGSGS